MNRGGVPWLLSLPLMTAGCVASHSVAYRLVDPGTAEPGHGYLAFAPLVLAMTGALGVVAAVGSALAGRAQRGSPIGLFGLLPPLAFSLQEHLERLPGGGAAVIDTTVEPVFLVGLALQVPFALCALVVGKSFLRAAEATGALLRRPSRFGLRPPTILRPALAVDSPRAAALTSRARGRAPPPQ